MQVTVSQRARSERQSEGSRSRVLRGVAEVVTPLMWQQWERKLEEHPDREWVEFLVGGLRHGC